MLERIKDAKSTCDTEMCSAKRYRST